MGSTRLPGKVLLKLGGRTVLEQVVRRARRASRIDRVVVATSDRAEDHEIAAWCETHQVPCVRGSAE
ncbi:MAG TPA: NTP transferase domain-containing protein, partial [Candidatus Ozemobacteraceae bacterium]|nr:NTP transferase domain-containing protein [Candidatus Ozemobacteraceae bacterium]